MRVTVDMNLCQSHGECVYVAPEQHAAHLEVALRAAGLDVDAHVRRGALRFATPEELLALTGCVPGAVPPFGNLFGLPVLADEALAAREEIVFNAGSNTRSIVMPCAEFLRLSRARVHPLSRD
jgi:prolyl-tRNA editing enzyme YbaK/EbsC (Cys-tRNA(Pro) deacylase)